MKRFCVQIAVNAADEACEHKNRLNHLGLQEEATRWLCRMLQCQELRQEMLKLPVAKDDLL